MSEEKSELWLLDEQYIEKLEQCIEELKAENHTFRMAQKACEDCDAPTMKDIEELEGLFRAIAHTPVAKLAEENRLLKAKLDAVELENKVLRNEESYEEWLTYVRSKTQEQKDE